MNFNVWNIKDMLSIPSASGTTKSSSWANNQNDYSSLSDSQFLFGSQFCPESSETLSAPLDVGVHLRDPKLLQKGSLDNEPSIFTKYQTKPQLFEEDINDGGLFPLPLPVGKSKGLLEQFEEKKRTAKDECDSEALYSFISHVRESIHKLQTSVEKSEEHLSSRSQSVLDSLESVAKTVQETARDQGSAGQAMRGLQEECEARHAEVTEMKSHLQRLEAAAAQQSRDLQRLGEQLGRLDVPGALAELRSFLSLPRGPVHVRDGASQTSPPRTRSLSPAPQAQDLRTGAPDVWVEGAKRAAVPEEAAGGGKRSRGVRDKTTQTDVQGELVPRASSEHHGASTPGPQASGRANNFGTSRKRPTKDTFSRDPGARGRAGPPQPRGTRRGRPPGRRQGRARGQACAFSPQCPPPPGPGSLRFLPEQQEPRAQPLRRGALGRNPTRPAPVGALRPRAPFAQDSSSQGDPQMRWFSDLNPASAPSPKAKQPVLYALGFDSSDESC